MALRLITIILLTLSAPLLGAETYYWVDENGKRHYGDRVPPKDSKRERQVIDERGFTVKTLPREKTPEEHARETEQAARQKQSRSAAEQARTEQIKYDTALLTTYENVDAIKQVRDDRLSILDASILVEVQTLGDNNQRLSQLRKQEKALLDQGRPVTPRLREQLDDTLNRIHTNERNITELKGQRRKIKDKYNQDIVRYQELKASASN